LLASTNLAAPVVRPAAGIGAVSELDRLGAAPTRAQQLVVDVTVNDQARAGHASLAGCTKVIVAVGAATSNRGADESSASELLRHLSVEDLSILALETDTVAGHTCKVIVLRDPIDARKLRASIGPRLGRVPALRMRLSQTGGEPCWMLDREVDLDGHVVVASAPGPVDMYGLRKLVARLFEQRLDRTRPLWRIDVVPVLDTGGSALVWRFHHAVADGYTSMRVARAALWDQGSDATAPAGRIGGAPSAQSRHRLGALAHSRHRLSAVHAAAREAPQPWHRSPFGGRIAAQRSVAFVSVQLDGMRRVARASDGATINDAVLTVVGGGLRRWLESRHGRLGSVRVKVPVSLHQSATPRGGGEHRDSAPGSDTGNRDSFFCLDLPLQPADPLARLRAVGHATRVRKEGHDAQQLDVLMRHLAHVPQLRSFAERVLTHPRSFALNVSNVPGPGRRVTVLGAPVRALYSLAEIREHHALRIAVVSLADTLNFGLTADPTLLSDVDQLADHIGHEAAALVARAQYV
jgi:diacylglycerol O-acyltransferase / wax synthase